MAKMFNSNFFYEVNNIIVYSSGLNFIKYFTLY